MRSFMTLFVLIAVGLSASGATDDPTRVDEDILRRENINTDGPALLKYIENLTVTAGDRGRIKDLIQKLGDDSFDEREKATERLSALGSVAIPFLKEATKNPDLEVVRRAEHCLKQIQTNAVGSHPAAVCRLLARKKPAGAVPILMAFLPCAEDETVADEARLALAAVAVKDGKPDPAIVAALSD